VDRSRRSPASDDDDLSRRILTRPVVVQVVTSSPAREKGRAASGNLPRFREAAGSASIRQGITLRSWGLALVTSERTSRS